MHNVEGYRAVSGDPSRLPKKMTFLACNYVFTDLLVVIDLYFILLRLSFTDPDTTFDLFDIIRVATILSSAPISSAW